MTPIVETGIFVPSPWTWPDGKVRLFAARTPATCACGHVRLGELRRVERDRDLLLLAAGDVDAGDALDAEERRLDLGLGDRARPRRGRPAVVAAIDAMITGEALMLSAATVGSTVGGRLAALRGSARSAPASP